MLVILGLALAGCAGFGDRIAPRGDQAWRQNPAAEAPIYERVGTASWYGAAHQGHVTASGERYDANRLTAAHLSLPFGTIVRVTNLANSRMVKVEVTDRGPYAGGRIIDLSRMAAHRLAIGDAGLARVRLEVMASDQETDIAIAVRNLP
jgi:rare lipoprotein A